MSQNSCLKSHSDRPNQYPINAPPAQSYCFEPHVNFDLSGFYYGFIGASLSENAGKWNTTEDIIIIFPKKIILAAASPDPNFVCLMADDPFRRGAKNVVLEFIDTTSTTGLCQRSLAQTKKTTCPKSLVPNGASRGISPMGKKTPEQMASLNSDSSSRKVRRYSKTIIWLLRNWSTKMFLPKFSIDFAK